MRQQRIEPAAIEAAIARLRSLAIDVLRRRWRAVFGRTPPAGLSKDLLGRMIACRLQEQAFGGLDRESLTFLDGLARHGGSSRRQLKPGTVLVRDYQGQRHTVTVTPEGFDWQGTTYASLSAIARNDEEDQGRTSYALVSLSYTDHTIPGHASRWCRTSRTEDALQHHMPIVPALYCFCSRSKDILKLPRFRGHPTFGVFGVHNGKKAPALYAGIPPADDRAGSSRSHAGGTG